MAAAVPFAIKAGSMLAGSLLGKKLSGPSKQQQAAMQQGQASSTALTQAAGPLMQQGNALSQAGAADYEPAASYYRNILTDRSQARNALAPEIKNAQDFYSGASSKAARTMRGGARDYALAQLDRERVGNIAMMLPTARANAAQGLGALAGQQVDAGTRLTGLGTNALSNAGYLNSRAFDDATAIRNQEEKGGSMWGQFLGDIAEAMPFPKGGPKPIPQRKLPRPVMLPPTAGRSYNV